ncbi:MAG: LEA type 2 family protein [Pedobacter sp.]|nr:LEA type 2 family protein [Pedobacter sp.]
MNKLFLFAILFICFSSCGINRQAQQLKMLEKCDYKLIGASHVNLAGTDVRRLIEEKSFSLTNIPSLALGYLKKDIPLNANLDLEISNPSTNLAAINNFEYIILVNQQEIANGSVDQRVSIAAGEKVRVPVQLHANVYQFIANGKILGDITSFLSGGVSGNEKKGLLTLKIKPSIMVGGSLVKYPGFITIDKEVSSKILF